MLRIYKRDVDNWLPMYWRWTFALIQMLEGVANLILVPFGYETDFVLSYMTWVYDRFTIPKTR